MSFDFVSTGIELPDNWKLTRIGDVAEVNPDTIKKKDEPTEIFYLDISSVSTGQYETPGYMKYIDAPSRAKRRLKPNDFIISTVRPNLRQFAMLEEVGENWVASTGFCVVRAKEARTAWYLYSFITSGLFNEHLVRVADGAAYPSFNPKEIEDAVIPWPADDDLYAINHFAKIINNKVELNRQTNQTLEQIAQAIFKSWFVDFEPTRAKIIAKEQGANPATQELAAQAIICGAITLEQLAEVEQNLETTLQQAIDEKLNQHKQTNPTALNAQQLKTTAALFPNELVESELGDVPVGWEVSGFKNIVKKNIDNRGKTPPTTESGVPLLEVKHLPEGSIKPDLNTTKYVDEETYATWFRAHLEPEDIIISTVGTIGRICMVPKGERMTIAQNLLGMRFDRNKVSPYFMYYQMSGFRFRHDVDARLVITVQASIKRKDLDTIDLLVPSVAIQNEFEKIVKPLALMQQSNQSLVLEELRNTLLPKLLSGELSVSAAADQITKAKEAVNVQS